MFVISKGSMHGWSVEVSRVDARFVVPLGPGERGAGFRLPRVWPGHGLGLPDRDLPCVLAAVGEVMKTAAYQVSRSRQFEYRGSIPWSLPRHDGEEFTYFPGPCEPYERAAGYRPRPCFAVEHVDLGQFRTRLADRLADRACRGPAVPLQRDHAAETPYGPAQDPATFAFQDSDVRDYRAQVP
jgi:hypothetical protein